MHFLFRTKWAKLKGTTYKRNSAVIISKEDDNFEVLIINKIFIFNGTKVYFSGNCYQLDTYHRHYRTHILTDQNRHIYVCYDQLYQLHCYAPTNYQNISPRHNHFITKLYLLISLIPKHPSYRDYSSVVTTLNLATRRTYSHTSFLTFDYFLFRPFTE